MPPESSTRAEGGPAPSDRSALKGANKNAETKIPLVAPEACTRVRLRFSPNAKRGEKMSPVPVLRQKRREEDQAGGARLGLTLYSGSGLTAGRGAGSFHSSLSTGTNSGMLAGWSTGECRRTHTAQD